MGKKYGLPYQGSKERIADKILALLPNAEVFVDLFAGGCAMTHAALLSGRYQRAIANDITGIPQVFLDGLSGKYGDYQPWVSREEFHRLRHSDPYVRLVWSFSNNLKNYLYGMDKEGFKEALHRAVMDRDVSALIEFGVDCADEVEIEDVYQRYIAIRNKLHSADYQSITPPPRKFGESWVQCDHYTRHRIIQGLVRDKSIKDRITVTQMDYQFVQIPANSVVYCDPPYSGTAGYGMQFDNGRLCRWLRSVDVPVYVSEYTMPGDFVCVGEWPQHKSKGHYDSVERLYLHERWSGDLKAK